MALRAPFNLVRWIDEHRHLLKPPVGNRLLFEDSGLVVMAVGGPNSRKDFHHDPGEEFFYQVEGDMVLKTVQAGGFVDIPIRAGEVFLLPALVPHSPQRSAGSVGIVVERPRTPEERDAFSWYCESCGTQLHIEQVRVDDIVTDLPRIFARFYADEALRTCRRCGTVMQPPAALPAPPAASPVPGITAPSSPTAAS